MNFWGSAGVRKNSTKKKLEERKGRFQANPLSVQTICALDEGINPGV